MSASVDIQNSQFAWNQVWNRSEKHSTYSFVPSRYERASDKIGYWIQSGLEFHQNEKVLEAGCGDGMILLKLMKLFSVNGFGVDFSHTALTQARKMASTEGLSPHYSQADICRMPFNSHTFDKVFSLGVVEHMPNILPSIEEMARVLKKDGTLILMTPNRFSMGRWQRLFQQMIGKWPYGYQDEYSPKELAQACRKAGLKVVRSESVQRRKMQNEPTPFWFIRRFDRIWNALREDAGFYSYVFAVKEN